MAKLSFRDVVNQGDVDEAIKLMDYSIRSLRNMKADTDAEKRKICKAFHYTYCNLKYIERDMKSQDRMS